MVKKHLLSCAILALIVPFTLSKHHNNTDVQEDKPEPPDCQYEVFSPDPKTLSLPVKIKKPQICSSQYYKYRPKRTRHSSPENWSVDGWYFRCRSSKLGGQNRADISLYATGNPKMKITCRANYTLDVKYLRAFEPFESNVDELSGVNVTTREDESPDVTLPYVIEVEFPVDVANSQKQLLTDFAGRFTIFNSEDESNDETKMITTLSVVDHKSFKAFRI